MISLILAVAFAYFLEKKYQKLWEILLYGLLAGLAVPISSSLLLLAFASQDISIALITFNVLSGVIPYTLLIYFFIWLSRRVKRKAVAVKSDEMAGKYWEQNEKEAILRTLEKHDISEVEAKPHNSSLEENIDKLSTEELVEKLNQNYFTYESVPSVLRVLKRRL
jgi:hypothetical protein